MRSRLPSMCRSCCQHMFVPNICRHGLNFIKLDGDIGCLGKFFFHFQLIPLFFALKD